MKRKISLLCLGALAFLIIQACSMGIEEASPKVEYGKKSSEIKVWIPGFGTLCGVSSPGSSCGCGTTSQTQGDTYCRMAAAQNPSKSRLKCWSGSCSCTDKGTCGLNCMECLSSGQNAGTLPELP